MENYRVKIERLVKVGSVRLKRKLFNHTERLWSDEIARCVRTDSYRIAVNARFNHKTFGIGRNGVGINPPDYRLSVIGSRVDNERNRTRSCGYGKVDICKPVPETVSRNVEICRIFAVVTPGVGNGNGTGFIRFGIRIDVAAMLVYTLEVESHIRFAGIERRSRFAPLACPLNPDVNFVITDFFGDKRIFAAAFRHRDFIAARGCNRNRDFVAVFSARNVGNFDGVADICLFDNGKLDIVFGNVSRNYTLGNAAVDGEFVAETISSADCRNSKLAVCVFFDFRFAFAVATYKQPERAVGKLFGGINRRSRRRYR